MKQVHFKILIVFFLFICFCFSSAIHAADTEETFTSPLGCIWGTLHADIASGSGIAKTTDGYIVSGYQANPPPMGTGGYGTLWKLNNSGHHIFYRTYEPPDLDDCPVGWASGMACSALYDVTVVPTNGGGEEYAATGYKHYRFTYQIDPLDTGEDRVHSLWLLTTDANGTVQVNIDYGNYFPQNADYGTSLDIYYTQGNTIVPVYDDISSSYDFLMGGYVKNNLDNYNWLLQADNSGIMEWEKQTFMPIVDYWQGINSIQPVSDGYILGTSMGIVKLNSSGTEEWSYPARNCQSVITDGDSYVGVCDVDNGENFVPNLIKLDGSGTELGVYPFPEADSFYKVIKKNDGYAVLGSISTKGHGGSDIWLLRTDSTGNRIWDIARGGEGDDSAGSFILDESVSEPGFIIAGTAAYDLDEDGTKENHIWVIKTKDEYIPPVVTFSCTPNPVMVEQDITCVASASDEDGTIDSSSYHWDFGDGHTDDTSGASPPPHPYDTPGDYTITLRVTDNDDVETVVSQTVTVNFLEIQWQRTFDNIRYGNNRCDPVPTTIFNQVIGNDMVMTVDNGFAIAGHSTFCSQRTGYGLYDPWLLKTDDRGIFLWEEDFIGFGGGDNNNRGAAVGIDNDGDGFILTGYIGWNQWNLDPDLKDLWVARTDVYGTPEWFKTFDNGFADEGRGISTLTDGYLVAGYQFTGTYVPLTNSRGWLLKLDNDGNEVDGANTVYSNEGLFFNTITALGDDDFLLTGGFDHFRGDKCALPLFNVKSNGTENWFEEWQYEPPPNSYLYTVGYWATQTPDGGFAVAGSLSDNMCLMKTGSPDEEDDFKHMFAEIYDSQYDDLEAIYTGVMTSDGGYLLGGMYHQGKREYDFHLIRLDANGNEKWRWIPNEGDDPYTAEYPRAIVALDDGGYVIMVTREYDIHQSHTDVWLIKIGPGLEPIAAFEANQTSGPLPLDVTFTDMSSNGTAPYEHNWNFGDGDTSSDPNPVHTYTVTGQYTVTLTITDDSDREDTYIRNLYITAGTPALAGDIDADGDVDGHDLYLLQQAMNSEPGDDNWNPNADLNSDGIINAADIDLFAGYFGD